MADGAISLQMVEVIGETNDRLAVGQLCSVRKDSPELLVSSHFNSLCCSNIAQYKLDVQ